MALPKRFAHIIVKHTKGAMGLGAAAGLIPVPHLDTPGIAAIWIAGVREIANEAGHRTTDKTSMGLVTAGVGGVAMFMAGVRLASWLLPLVGPFASMGINSALNGLFTYRFLRSVGWVYDAFDTEEVIQQNLANGAQILAGLLGIFTIPGDVSDMAASLGSIKDLT
jgi:uncharacterized protein (DUF697 family)